MEAKTNPPNKVESLSTIFHKGLDLYNNLGDIEEPTNSPSVQVYRLNKKSLLLLS